MGTTGVLYENFLLISDVAGLHSLFQSLYMYDTHMALFCKTSFPLTYILR